MDNVARHAYNLSEPFPRDYNMYRYWELNDKPSTFDQALHKNMFSLEDDGYYHARSVMQNENGDYEFMKSKNHPTRWMETGWYKNGPIINGINIYQYNLNHSIPKDIKRPKLPSISDMLDWTDFKDSHDFVEETDSTPAKYIQRKKIWIKKE